MVPAHVLPGFRPADMVVRWGRDSPLHLGILALPVGVEGS